LVLIIFQGCASKPQSISLEPPCYDGWAYEGEMKSKLWTPSATELDELIRIIPKERKIHCWHVMPSGSYAAITSGQLGNYYQTNFQKLGSAFRRLVEYEIVTVH